MSDAPHPKPVVGRMVHWYPSSDAVANYQPHAAIILEVKRDARGSCRLYVFPPGTAAWKVDAPYSEQPRAHCWTWPRSS